MLSSIYFPVCKRYIVIAHSTTIAESDLTMRSSQILQVNPGKKESMRNRGYSDEQSVLNRYPVYYLRKSHTISLALRKAVSPLVIGAGNDTEKCKYFHRISREGSWIFHLQDKLHFISGQSSYHLNAPTPP